MHRHCPAGQTGAGKTHVMGTAGGGGGGGRGPGSSAWPHAVVPRAGAHLFANVAQLKENLPGTEVNLPWRHNSCNIYRKQKQKQEQKQKQKQKQKIQDDSMFNFPGLRSQATVAVAVHNINTWAQVDASSMMH